MIINKLYQTKITSSNYNIDLNSTATITVTLTDFNNAVITGESVSISANVGSFSSNTGTTNSSEQVTFTYTASTAGLVNITCNSESIQLLVAHNPYPIGSIYMSVNSTSPATLFGGTWEQLKDRFLLGAGDTYSNGGTGGAATHNLTEAELPVISGSYGLHGQESGTEVYNITGYATGTKKTGQYRSAGSIVNSAYSQQDPGFKFGQGQSHNNMPPYLVVYMWKRTG